MKKIWIGALFLAVVMAGVAPVKLWAQPVAVDTKQKDTSEKNTARPFKVTGHTVHAEAPRAEVCLAFTQPLATEASGEMDRAKIAATLKMKKNGRVQKILAEDLSLTADDLCVQGLEHHVMYQLTVRGLEAKGGAKLASAYTATFTVPDRKPSLAFVMDTTSSVLPRHAKKTATDKENPWGMAHVLRSVGILATHLTLYRVEDRTAQAGAWQQFKQLHLSPSESLTFARDNGKVVFESDLVFGDQPNVEQTLIAPLPSDEALTAGLYYLAAVPRGKTAPTLFAGQWFLVSDLHASALAVPGGVQVFVKGGDSLSPKEGVSLALFMRDAKNVMHSVVEGKTDASGAAFLPLPADRKAEGLTLLAQQADGALDLIEITPSRLAPVSYQPRSGSVALDRALYAPADRAAVTLRVEGGTAQESGKSETVLKLLRADRQVLAEQTVPPMAQNGNQGASQTIGQTIALTLPVTAKTNIWTVSWQEKGGRVLAEAPLKVAPAGTAAKVIVSANRVEGADNGSVFVIVRTLDAKGNAASYQEGVLRVKPVRPVLEGWEAYRFGITPQQEGQTVLSLPFMTNAEGTARLNVDTGAAALQTDALSFVATLDTTVQSSPQLVPVSKKPAFIGLRALPDARPFPENSVARFDVIALDRSRKRIAQGDLYYVVYEEGRSFDWFASEGHWDYMPLPQHRRVGGGALSLSATGETIVSWPVTMGRYALEITSARGEVLARHGFEAGRRGGQEIAKDEGKLRFGSLPDALQVGKTASLPLHLSAPAIVNVVVTDGKIRQTLHSAFGAGERAIAVVPAADWGREALVRVEAVLEGSTDPVMASVALPVRLPGHDAETKTALPPLPQGEAQAMAITAKPADVLHKGDRVPLVIEIENVAAEKGIYTYAVEAPAALAIKGEISGKLDFRKDKKKTLRLMVTAGAAMDGHVRVTLTAADAKAGAKTTTKAGAKPVPAAVSYAQSWPIRVVGDEASAVVGEALTLEPEKTWEADAKTKKMLMSPLALPEMLPAALAAFVRDEPQTTMELALWLDAARRWEAPLVELGVVTGDYWKNAQSARLAALLKRQNDDGGFAATRAGQPSDLAATAYALPVLKDSHGKMAAFAAAWLEAKLKNTWFDEAERNDRALAFEALARMARADISALRYFAETSADKPLSGVAVAALASALRQGGDEAAAKIWDEKERAMQPLSWNAVRLAMMNDKNDAGVVAARIAAAKEVPFASPTERAAMAASLAQAALRMGSWRGDINGKDTKHFGLFAWARAGEEGAGVTIRNAAGRPLYGLRLIEGEPKKAESPARAVSLTRELYTAVGDRMASGETLRAGETYILVLQGQGKKEQAALLRFVLPRSAGLSVSMPLSGDAAVMKSVAPWISRAFSPLSGVVSEGGSVGFAVDVTRDWATAVYVKAERAGSYSLPRLIAYDEAGDVAMTQNDFVAVIED